MDIPTLEALDLGPQSGAGMLTLRLGNAGRDLVLFTCESEQCQELQRESLEFQLGTWHRVPCLFSQERLLTVLQFASPVISEYFTPDS